MSKVSPAIMSALKIFINKYHSAVVFDTEQSMKSSLLDMKTKRMGELWANADHAKADLLEAISKETNYPRPKGAGGHPIG